MPQGRTTLYAVWRACERFKLNPYKFYKLPCEKQAELIAFNQVREHEEIELVHGPIHKFLKAMAGKKK